jgi:hypothetical protein
MLNDNKITPIELLILAKIFTFTTKQEFPRFIEQVELGNYVTTSCPRFI